MSAEKGHKIINIVDQTIHNDILRLVQKLKGLRAEIDAQIDAMAYSTNVTPERKKYLPLLSNEIDQALQSIDGLISMVLVDGVSDKDFLQMNHDDLASFHEIVKENTKRIEEIKDLL